MVWAIASYWSLVIGALIPCSRISCSESSQLPCVVTHAHSSSVTRVLYSPATHSISSVLVTIRLRANRSKINSSIFFELSYIVTIWTVAATTTSVEWFGTIMVSAVTTLTNVISTITSVMVTPRNEITSNCGLAAVSLYASQDLSAALQTLVLILYYYLSWELYQDWMCGSYQILMSPLTFQYFASAATTFSTTHAFSHHTYDYHEVAILMISDQIWYHFGATIMITLDH
jgi:hypothetical protein